MKIDKSLLEAFLLNSESSSQTANVNKVQEDQKGEKALDPSIARASTDAVKVEIDRQSSSSSEKIAQLKARIENDADGYYRENREGIASAVERELLG